MELAYWQLGDWPFCTTLDADRYYPSPGHEEALARLEYLLDARRRMGVLLGEPGVGKSLLLQLAGRRLAREGRTIVTIDAVGLTTRELLWQLAAGLGAAPPQDTDVPRLWRHVADRLAENRWQQIDTVLLLDDAGQAGPDLMTHIVRLARIDATPDARWTMLLAAEPAQASRWSDAVREMIDLRIEIQPWSLEDTVGFVQHALVEAGRFEPVFDDRALAALFELSGGAPRRVVRLAELALLTGASAGWEMIDAAAIRAAHSEFGWHAAAGVH